MFTTSLGLEDQALTDLIARNYIPVKLVTLDTGRLFPETYNLIDRTKAKYNLDIKNYFPNTLSLEEFVNEQGMNSIVSIVERHVAKSAKIDPLYRALKGSVVWITGLRADQSKNEKQ